MAERRTKKLINNPDDVISQMLDGVAGAHPALLRVEGRARRAVVAVDGPRDGKVAVVVGGGSGHEPAFFGYVGRGLADAAAVGNVFASPSPEQAAEAARAVDGGAGALFIYGNYTGDVMNFDMAAELLAGDGIEARSVQVTDDVASAPSERRHERRGIAGDGFVFKIAGAAADLGHDLDGVERLARHANRHTASMGVALTPCSLPQTAVPNFEIGDGEMEIGMGLHGEPGISRVPLESADSVADRLLEPILADLALAEGERVAVMVNGLGATPQMELYILHRRVKARLDEVGVVIHRSFVGEYATSLEMGGASVTVMKLDAELEALLDHPCHALAWSHGAPAAPSSAGLSHRRHEHARRADVHDDAALREDGDITPAGFRSMMLAAAEAIAHEKDRLSALDGVIGDGDHGVTMDMGWRAIVAALNAQPEGATVTAQCRVASSAFLEAVGASAGPLYATAFLKAAEAVRDRRNLDAGAVARLVAAMAEGIAGRGGAVAGDKTMLDAWLPAAEAAASVASRGGSTADCLSGAAQAAAQGARRTADLVARKGRSAKLGERGLGHVDAGAASAAVILAAWSASLSTLQHEEDAG